MITVTSTANAVPPSAGLLERHHFLLRRLHSLSGIVPVGFFLCFHLFTNMQMVFGTFQHEVDWIHAQPALLFMEIFILWIPIAFHAGLGVWYTFTGKSNVKHYGYWDNWRYTLQRITGMIALVFIFYHVATLRWRWTLGFDTPFFSYAVLPDADGSLSIIPFAHASTAMAMQAGFGIIALFYLVGVFSAVYHFANGLWTAAITWGLTLTAKAQRRWGGVCLVVCLSLASFAAASFVGALGYSVTDEDRAAMEATKQVYRDYGVLFHKEDKLDPPAMQWIDGRVVLLDDEQ